MRVAIPLLLITVVGITDAQQPPNFSGEWVVVRDRSVWHNTRGEPINITVFGERFTAKQTDQVLTIAIDNEAGYTWVYRLDGSSARNTLPFAGGQETTSVASWNGLTLTITTVAASPGQTTAPAETRRTIRFNDDGTLRVEAPWGAGGAMIGSVYSRAR